MRSKIVFALLLLMFVGLGVSLTMRRMRATAALPTASGSFSAPTVATSPMPSASDSGAPRAEPQLLDRPLRIVALGWDLVAPGVLTNDGLTSGKASAYAKAKLPLSLRVVDALKPAEEALARGGTDDNGADIALLPLPVYVAAYEHLRALHPVVFFTTGWSDGREALYAEKGSLMGAPAGQVQLVARPASTEAYLGAFLLELVGVPTSRLQLVDKPDAATITYTAARLEGTADPQNKQWGKLLLTTADVPDLVPLVAVAPAGFVRQHGETLHTWARLWLQGQKRIQDDAASAARVISSYPGAPEPLVLVNRLGPIRWASLSDNATMAGLAGRGAVTLETLFQGAWNIWRDLGLLTTPIPEEPCVDPSVVESLVRSQGVQEGSKSELAHKKSTGPQRTLMVVAVPGPKLDQEVVVGRIGLLAGLFHRSILRISTASPAQTTSVLDAVRGRFGIDASRLVAGKKALGGATTVIEVVSVH